MKNCFLIEQPDVTTTAAAHSCRENLACKFCTVRTVVNKQISTMTQQQQALIDIDVGC